MSGRLVLPQELEQPNPTSPASHRATPPDPWTSLTPDNPGAPGAPVAPGMIIP